MPAAVSRLIAAIGALAELEAPQRRGVRMDPGAGPSSAPPAEEASPEDDGVAQRGGRREQRDTGVSAAFGLLREAKAAAEVRAGGRTFSTSKFMCQARVNSCVDMFIPDYALDPQLTAYRQRVISRLLIRASFELGAGTQRSSSGGPSAAADASAGCRCVVRRLGRGARARPRGVWQLAWRGFACFTGCRPRTFSNSWPCQCRGRPQHKDVIMAMSAVHVLHVRSSEGDVTTTRLLGRALSVVRFF